jgi:hypothetical protein
MSSHQLSQLLGNSEKLMKVTFILKSDANKEVSIYMRRGGIALQIHSGGGIKVKWRNIKLKEL